MRTLQALGLSIAHARYIREHQCGAWGANFESGDVIAENCNFYTSKFDFGNKSEIHELCIDTS
jgi:hypothetical protein